MARKTRLILIWSAVGLAIAGGIFWMVTAGRTPGQLDEFAMCLRDKGAVFYGAFWCPHCRAQKAMFGNSVKYLPYVECSTPDGKDQLQICKDKQITGYPTWVFADDSRQSGEAELSTLAEKTGCSLPEDL